MHFLELKKKYQATDDAAKSLEAKLILLESNKKCVEFYNLIDELVPL